MGAGVRRLGQMAVGWDKWLKDQLGSAGAARLGTGQKKAVRKLNASAGTDR